jgi:hypothetical protein
MSGKVSIVIEEFRRVRRGSLVGFATLRVRQWFLRIHGVSIYELRGSRWAAMPSRPQVSRDGDLIRNDGKIAYASVLKISSAEARAAFSAAVVAALLEFDPNAFNDADEHEVLHDRSSRHCNNRKKAWRRTLRWSDTLPRSKSFGSRPQLVGQD